MTMKLWGGESDTGCCSVSDVDDARRVAQQLGIAHHVWTFTDDFERHVVGPYVDAHRRGVTPNPCIECNRHLKFDRLLRRADAVGFDAVATGHHARIVERPDGTRRLARGADAAKDQSYVLYVLGQAELARTLLPVGDMTKDEVRAEAAALGPAHRRQARQPGRVLRHLDRRAGRVPGRPHRPAPGPGGRRGGGPRSGAVDAVELVTVGQRRGLGLPGGGAPRYVGRRRRAARRRCASAPADDLLVERGAARAGGVGRTPRSTGPVAAQCSAHGAPRPAPVEPAGRATATARRGCGPFAEPQRRVAAGQSVVLYEGDEVVGGGIAACPADRAVTSSRTDQFRNCCVP